jgi:hypothetical protein
MFKVKSGIYRLQVERERPGLLFVQVLRRDQRRMVWNQLPSDSGLPDSVHSALRVMGVTDQRHIDMVVGAITMKFAA